MAKDKTTSSTKCGVRSPMSGFRQNENIRTPQIGTTEVIRGTAPKAAKISSPTAPKNPGRSN
jgi:hypothetical protein